MYSEVERLDGMSKVVDRSGVLIYSVKNFIKRERQNKRKTKTKRFLGTDYVRRVRMTCPVYTTRDPPHQPTDCFLTGRGL